MWHALSEAIALFAISLLGWLVLGIPTLLGALIERLRPKD
ncbi:hypothetical protein SAMN05444320_11365 [Streptoalloteichus hindustanus]|uniref:Uncharacterized protein n=1 Tax=Streptoalloteichus hindustanus TaxID=2017 RepID=A0A1M5MBS8_STRHI|nr:hypothetical protein SAMN05444320_11365 [Streptoalloteichus hindustanus]